VPSEGRPSIRSGNPHPRAGPRLRLNLLAQGALAFLLAAGVAAPPLFEADALSILRAGPRGLEIRAERIDGVTRRACSPGVSSGAFGPERLLEGSAVDRGANLTPRAGAPPLRDISVTGTLVDALAGKPWAVPDVLVRIAGRHALAGAITGPAPAASEAERDRGGTLGIDLSSPEPLDLATFSPALTWVGAEGWRASGTAAITVSARLSASGRGPCDARAKLSFRGFGFSSPGDTPELAAEKLDGHFSVTAGGTLSPRRLRLDVTAGASGFEFLSGVTT
jgi:hypothetical protein